MRYVKKTKDILAAQKRDENHRAVMSKIKRTNERASTIQCPFCLNSHDNYKVRYDSKNIPFVMCGITHRRINLDANWIINNHD